jgi:carboxyl-terminal processing protease
MMLNKRKNISIILTLYVICALAAGCSKEEFGGLGIEVPTGEGKVTSDSPYVIVSVYKQGTGDLAGLQSGDKILTVDGNDLKGMQYDYIVKNLLRGKPGTMVTLEVERSGQTMIFRVLRGRIVLKD